MTTPPLDHETREHWSLDALRLHLTTRIEANRDRCLERNVSLSELTDAKFVTFRTLVDSQADKVALALAAAKEAIDKAETATEKRFDSVNEFRAQLSDQAGTFYPRKEAEQRLTDLREKIEIMTELRLADMKLVREQVILADAKLEERLMRLEHGNANMQGRMWALGVAMTLVIVLVNLAVRFI